jgi:GNAT superfamily N-acetyltransferase
MTAPLTVRSANPADVAAIAALVCQWKADEGRTTIDEAGIEQAVRACVEAAGCDVLVGYLVLHRIPFPMLEGAEGYISDLIVERTMRGAGVGSQLIRIAEARARERRCKRLILNNRITAQSFIRQFYPKRGISSAGRIREFGESARLSAFPASRPGRSEGKLDWSVARCDVLHE